MGEEFGVSTVAGAAVVTVPAEIDHGNAQALRGLLADATSTSVTVVVDMTSIEFCDSSGMSVLVEAARKAAKAGGEVRLALNGAGARRVFRVTGAERMFRIFDTVADAASVDPASPGQPR